MSVACDRCDAVYPSFCERCRYLMSATRAWRRVAMTAHEVHCDRKHTPRDCDAYLETVFDVIRERLS